MVSRAVSDDCYARFPVWHNAMPLIAELPPSSSYVYEESPSDLEAPDRELANSS